MATKQHVGRSTAAQAKAAASHGAGVRDRVRDLTVRALRDRKLERGKVSGLVDEVLEGATAAVDESIPASRRSVLRQVFEGMSDAVETVAEAGAGAVRGVRRRGGAILEKDVPAAAKRLDSVQEEFLGAVSKFAGRVSGEAREELDDLVRRARKAGPELRASARDVAHAADGRLLELTGETARAGATAARRVAGGLAMAAGGLMEGLAEVISPAAGAGGGRSPARKARPAARRKARPGAKPKSRAAKPKPGKKKAVAKRRRA
jgi:hypothetical protein